MISTYAHVLVTANPASKFWLFLLHREMCSDWLFGYAGDYRMHDLRIPQAFKLGDESHPVWQDLKYAVFFSCVYPILQHVLYKTIFEVSVLHLLRLFGGLWQCQILSSLGTFRIWFVDSQAGPSSCKGRD